MNQVTDTPDWGNATLLLRSGYSSGGLWVRGTLASLNVLGDLPDMARGISESGGALAPFPGYRTIEKWHATLRQFRANGIGIID